MRIFHILPFNEYGKNFISLLERNQDEHSHNFYITNQELDGEIEYNILSGFKQYVTIYFAFFKYDKVFCHGLFNNRHNVVFLLSPFVNKKLYWIGWGGDLYFYKHRGDGFKDSLAEFVRKLLFKRVSNFITSTPGDFELFYSIYNNNSIHHIAKYYLPIHFSNQKSAHKATNILVGNSASYTNNHLEVIERIVTEVDIENKTLYFPLSYGDKLYAESVIKIGNEKLGNHFVSITEYIQYDNYMEFLEKINVAIMYHDRQQAMGNIIQLLALGKKVYLRSETTHFVNLTRQGFKIFDANENLSSIEVGLTAEDAQKNIDLVKDLYSEERLIKQWSAVFSYHKE